MGVTRVAEIPTSPRSRRTLGGKQYIRTFHVHTDTLLDGPYIARNASGVPEFGATYEYGNESDSTALVIDIDSVRAAPFSTLWIVTVTYGQVPEGQSPQVDKFTLSERSWDAVNVTRYIDKDLDGVPLRNSAGERFDPAPPFEYVRPILRVTKNIPNFDPAIILAYSNALNSDFFYGWGPGYWRMMPIRSTEQSQVFGQIMVKYDAVSYEVHFDMFGWKTEILDMGMNEKLDFGQAGILLVPIHRLGAYITAPVMLDGAGRDKSPDADPVYGTFRMLHSMPFGPLGL